jgi:hypothetical protein
MKSEMRATLLRCRALALAAMAGLPPPGAAPSPPDAADERLYGKLRGAVSPALAARIEAVCRRLPADPPRLKPLPAARTAPPGAFAAGRVVPLRRRV